MRCGSRQNLRPAVQITHADLRLFYSLPGWAKRRALLASKCSECISYQMRVAHYQCLPALGVHHICRMTETQKRGNIRKYICERARDDSDQTHGSLIWIIPGYILDTKFFIHKDSDQTVRMHRLILVTNGCTCLFVLRFYSPVNPMGSCRAQSVYLTTHLLGRLSPPSG